MNEIHFPEIKTERLVLRKPMKSDWKMISYLRSDKEVNKLVNRPSAETKEKALDFIARTNDGIENQSLFYWCITKSNDPTMIGSICLWNFSQDRKTAEIGYDLSPEFQQMGIMNEAMKCVLEFGFNTLHLNLIEAFTHHNNERSKKVLIRNNFKLNNKRIDKEDKDNIIFENKKGGN